MAQRRRLSLYIPGSPPGGALPDTTYTPSSGRRRSLISLTADSLGIGSLTGRSKKNNLDRSKPSRARLPKYWPRAQSPTAPHGTANKDHTTAAHDLSTLVLLAGEQMAALGDPRRKTPSLGRPPGSRRMDGPKLRRDLEMTLPASATALSRPRSSASIQRKPLPRNAVLPPCCAAAPVVPAPTRAPPPPPIPELSAVHHHRPTDGDMAVVEQPLPTSTVFTPSTARRRAKTPVHQVGQLEAAAQRDRFKKLPHRRGTMDAVANRMSSVSTVALGYRELAVDPETDVPDVPKSDPLCLMKPDIVDAQGKDCQDGRLLGAPHHNHRRSSSSASQDGTLPRSEPDTTSLGSCPSLTPSSSPPPASETSDDAGSEPPALASLRLQIGIELLTQELSTAFAANRQSSSSSSSSSSRRQNDVGGLQIWVMIEAYERLREQLDARPAEEENKQARDAVDAWIRALHAIHGNIASDAGGRRERV